MKRCMKLALCAAALSAAFAVDAAPYSPRVAEGTQVAAFLRMDGKGAVARFVDRVVGLAKENPRNHGSESQLESMRESMKTYGLDSLDVEWCLWSVGGFHNNFGYGREPVITVVIAGRNDISEYAEKIKSLCENASAADNGPTGVEAVGTTLEGERVLAFKLEMGSRVTIFAASLDGELLIFSTSRARLAREIRLYRSGEGESALFGVGWIAADDEMRVCAPSIGELLGDEMEYALRHVFDVDDRKTSLAFSLVRNLGVRFGADRDVELSLLLDSEADAQIVADVLNKAYARLKGEIFRPQARGIFGPDELAEKAGVNFDALKEAAFSCEGRKVRIVFRKFASFKDLIAFLLANS